MKIAIEVKPKMIGAPEWRRSSMCWTFQDCAAKVSDDDGNEIGEVVGTLGGGVQVTTIVNGKRYRWLITPQEFWEAFQNVDHKAAAELGPDHWIPREKRDA